MRVQHIARFRAVALRGAPDWRFVRPRTARTLPHSVRNIFRHARLPIITEGADVRHRIPGCELLSFSRITLASQPPPSLAWREI